MEGWMKKTIISIVIALLVLVAGVNSCSVIDPNERGIDVKLGQMQDTVIQPGLHWKAPFITSTRKFKLEPKVYEVTFSVGNDGAITKDMQTVGATVAVRYVYDESRLKDIVTSYANGSIIESAMKDNVKASLKETTGKYSIYELVAEQNTITEEVAKAMLNRMSNYPISINQTTITNWDWSDDFDRQIKETANRTQQVKQAEQEANIAAAQAQKLVKEAEAKKQAAELDAQAAVARAQGEADAKKISADAQAYENQKIAQNLAVMKAQWDYEVAKIRAEKFNGVEVSSQSVYVPNTYDLKSGK
jgi:regulator of protease activity HflC (stomatin/prohibitin superfamily)